MKTGEDAIYAHHMIKDVMMPKFLVFIFEGTMNNDECYISGYKTISLIEPETIIKGIKYILVGGICSPTKIHFTSFLYNYKINNLNLEEGNSYYYDGMDFNGGIIKVDNILNFIIDKNPCLLMQNLNN